MSIMPLSSTPGPTHDGCVRSPRIPRPAGPTLLLLRDPEDRDRFLGRPTRSWDRFVAGVRAPSLDRRLAAGNAPESSRLLATRAQILVSPQHRRALARCWAHLLEVIENQPGQPLRRLPLCRDRITAAAPSVGEMLVALEAPAPVPVRGVAMAGVLLCDGTGPLYNPLAPLDLLSSVREVTMHLDPAASLVATP
jgi:hypothetical protein